MIKAGTYYQHQLTSFLLIILVIITFFVLVVFFSAIYVLMFKGVVRYVGHQKAAAESLAFFSSTLALLVIRYPRIYLLYARGPPTAALITVKVVGSQWYWTFEVGELVEEPVYIYILPLEELMVGESRFLEVENRLVLPVSVMVQFNVTSRDVLHSFSIPTLGIKVDATPGLLTVVRITGKKIGVHYGQCAEICGINHAFIPFVIEIVPFQRYLYWSMLQIE